VAPGLEAPMLTDELLDAAVGLMRGARVAVLTGAGVSTDSGIPDYRGPDSPPRTPMTFQQFVGDPAFRRHYWARNHVGWRHVDRRVPNAGHRALARLVEKGRMAAVVTQNIDGLHQASGVPDDKVIELHGNTTYAACLDCRRRYELDWVREIFAIDERLPLCTACGGIVKTATISFGQSMPEAAMQQAQEATLAADLFIVLGSSLVVYPAAGFPILAKRNGSRLVIVNRDPTDQDELADLVINAEIGSTMSRAVGVN